MKLKIIIKSVVIKNSETDYNMQFQNGLKSSCSQERYFHIAQSARMISFFKFFEKTQSSSSGRNNVSETV